MLAIGQALFYVALARILLRPTSPEIRAVSLSDETAMDLYQRVRRLIFWAMIGSAIFNNVIDLKVPPGVFAGLERLWGLVMLVMVLLLLIRYSAPLTDWIQGENKRLALVRRFAARVWLPAAVLYAVSAYLIWALEVYDGFKLLAQGGLLTVLVLFAIQPAGDFCLADG